MLQNAGIESNGFFRIPGLPLTARGSPGMTGGEGSESHPAKQGFPGKRGEEHSPGSEPAPDPGSSPGQAYLALLPSWVFALRAMPAQFTFGCAEQAVENDEEGNSTGSIKVSYGRICGLVK